MGFLAFVLLALALYAGVRLLGAVASALSGGRYRAYKQLAGRYRGRYESRGLVDPPTVSFNYNGSSVRVGLAPVVAGQPNPPRTRIVSRFAAGLPLRLELFPALRPAPTQQPRGTRPIRIGDPAFDREFVVRANDPEIARTLLVEPEVRRALDVLRRFAPPAGFLLTVNPERLLVQIDRDLGAQSAALDQAVREALVLNDRLLISVETQGSRGVSVLSTEPTEADLAPLCKVCGEDIEGKHVACDVCKSPHHDDCWAFVGGCAIYGCVGKQAKPIVRS